MSVEIPKAAIVFGSVTPPQGDIIDLRVHLGCTKEVSSFECVLQNWDKKYSPGGTSPINVGDDGHIDIGRGTNVPQIITCRVEKVQCESTPNENYIRVSGRCWGERIFRRVVTKTYENKKGEEIVKDIIDNYVGLSHVRDSTELIENTDTTYTFLEYENTPVFDILKYIVESSDKAGVIGYDFRVAPDGKFEFFPKNSKSSSVSLSEKIEVSEYRKDIHRVRNKIMIYGLADKSVPEDKDTWTESLTPTDGVWSAGAGEVSLDTSFKARGSASIKLYAVQNYYGAAIFTLNAGKEVNSNLYPILSFTAFLEKAYNGNVTVVLYDTTDKSAVKHITIGPGEWHKTDLKVGLTNEIEWEEVDSGFDWSQIKKFRIDCWFSGVGTASFWVDGLYFGGRRYSASREDATSQSDYGLRELVEVDEELVSDNECDLRAKALLDYFKDPAVFLRVSTTVLDYGSSPVLPGDKIHVTLPNENVDEDFRIESVEYSVDASSQTLQVVLELGKVPPFLADYLYGMRATTVTVEKLARTKLGKKGIPSGAWGGGGIGAHHSGHEAGDEAGDPWSSEDYGGWDKITGWIAPTHIAPESDTPAIIKFRTKNKAGTAVVDHQFNPSDDEHGVFGSETLRWKEMRAMFGYLYNSLRLKVAAEDNAKALLDLESLQFGPGGAVAPDTYLKRLGDAQFEVKASLFPDTTGARDFGSSSKVWDDIWGMRLHVGDHVHIPSGCALFMDGGEVRGSLIPDTDISYDLGSSAKRWSSLYVNGLGKVGWLNIGDYTVVTSSRVLQNVTADAAIITSGRFPLARLSDGDSGKFLRAYGAGYDPMYALLAEGDIPSLPASKITSGRFVLARLPVGTDGYVLEAQGPSYDPMYVNPNGRYSPAAHESGHNNLYPGGGSDTGQVGNTTNYWNVIAGNSIWYKAIGQFDALDDLGLISRIKADKRAKMKNGLPLADPESFPEEVTENGFINAGALTGLLIGAVKQLAARIEALEKRLEAKGVAA